MGLWLIQNCDISKYYVLGDISLKYCILGEFHWRTAFGGCLTEILHFRDVSLKYCLLGDISLKYWFAFFWKCYWSTAFFWDISLKYSFLEGNFLSSCNTACFGISPVGNNKSSVLNCNAAFFLHQIFFSETSDTQKISPNLSYKILTVYNDFQIII